MFAKQVDTLFIIIEVRLVYGLQLTVDSQNLAKQRFLLSTVNRKLRS